MMPTPPLHNLKIGIAGAGLLGRLLAFALIQKGCAVTLFDQDIVDGKLSCGMSAAGMLTPFAELDSIEPSITEMGIRSLTKWPQILKQLKQSIYFQQTGSLMLAHAQDHAELSHFKQLYNKVWAEHLSTDASSAASNMKTVDSTEILALEPELAPQFREGLYFPQEGQICPRDLFSALASALQEGGVDWREKTKIIGIKPYQISCEEEDHRFDWVFDCRGLGAKPDQPSLRGVRGELIELHAPDVQLNRIIRLMHPRYALYIVPRPKQHFIVGASSIESEDKSPISVQTALELLSAAYSLHRGFAEARIVECRVNCRPAFPDNLPRIDYQHGLTGINGLYRHGYLLAPCLVEEAVGSLGLGSTTE